MSQLWQHLEYDWKCIGKILNITDDNILFVLTEAVQKLVYSSPENILNQKGYNFSDYKEREKFEI